MLNEREKREVRIFKIYSLSNFQVYDTVLLTTVTMLHIISPELICLICLYLLTTFIHSFQPHPSTLATTNLVSISESCFFFFFRSHIQVRQYGICLCLYPATLLNLFIDYNYFSGIFRMFCV